MLGDRGDAGGQAAGQADEDVLDRGGAEVLGGEALGVVGVELIGRAMLLLAPRPVKPVDGGVAVRAVAPGAAGPPRELGGLGRADSASRASSRAWTLTPLSTGCR